MSKIAGYSIMDGLELLEEIKNLAFVVTTTYMQIGGLLRRARDTSAYTDGGYESVEMFAEDVLKYKPRKTRMLIKASEVADRWSVSEEAQHAIGPSKLLMLDPVLNAENKDEWLGRAAQNNTHTLKNMIAQERGFPIDLRKPFTVLLDEDQLQTVEQAIALALKIAGTESRGIALVSLCQEAVSSWEPIIAAEADLIGSQDEPALAGQAL